LLGREPHNDVQIDNLAVSGEHAAIITILNDSFIEDLNSTNGTIVNGKPVKKHFLQNGDVIEIGKHKLKYFNDQPNNASSADFEKTMIIRAPAKAPEPKLGDTQIGMQAIESGGAPIVRAAEPAVAEVAPSTPLREAQIQVLSGGAAGRTLDLTKNLTTIGKPGSQVAVITKRPNGYFITHVEGATFPLVNGKELTPQATTLDDHDLIEIAGIKMEFFFKP
jgi:hypothetical protein